MNNIEKIIAYEQGSFSPQEQVEFFAELIKTGLCWHLQRHYGRAAQAFIDSKFISKEGVINQQLIDYYIEELPNEA